MVRRKFGIWCVMSTLMFVALAAAAAPSALANKIKPIEQTDGVAEPINVHYSFRRHWQAGSDAIAGPGWEVLKEYEVKEIDMGNNIFQGVAWTGALPCHSEGASEGEVVTNAMTYQLGYINAKRKEVGIEERPTSGTLVAKFTCGENTVELRGGVIGKLAKVKGTVKEGATVANEVTVNAETGKNVVTHFEHGPEVVMEESVNGSSFKEVPWEDSGKISVTGGTFKIKTAKTGPEFVVKATKPKKEKK